MLASLTGLINREKKMTEKALKKNEAVTKEVVPVDTEIGEKVSTSIESVEKTTVVLKEKTKRKHARTVPYMKKPRTWNTYLYRVLKETHPDTGITRKSMAVMNDVVEDMFEKIMNEASELARKDQRHTLTTREIQSAVRLVLPGELARHAVSEGHAAFVKYLENTKKVQ
jgi:histone H2B